MAKAKGAVVVGVAFLICSGLFAQQKDDPIGANPLHGAGPYVPRMTLSDARAFPFGSAFAWMATPNNFLPDWKPAGWENEVDLNSPSRTSRRRQNTDSKSIASYSKDSSTGSVEVRRSLWDNVHGEVGFLYGRSTGGRVSQDVEAGYISATAGDDKVQISVGASYEHSNIDFSRRGR